MRNILLRFSSIIFVLLIVSCEGIVEGVNDNPNELPLESVNPDFLLTGVQLANSVGQSGHLNRISNMWSGQLIGFTSLYGNIHGYEISTAETVSTWSRFYVGTVANTRTIVSDSRSDAQIRGIAKVLEAHAIGTAASLFGDVPFSQTFQEEIEDPVFDNQISVFNSAIDLLNDAITELSNAAGRDIPEDLHFGGDPAKWTEVAYTLKARYYLQLKDYNNAAAEALNGIASPASNLLYVPTGDPDRAEGDKNLFWTILEGARTGDIGTGNSYLMQLLDPTNADSRNNAKTNESARFGYYTIDETGGDANLGVIEQFEPHRMVTYEENLLILAETGVRTKDFDTGLSFLNLVRAYYSTGGYLNENFNDPSMIKYESYVASDFESGGLENPDGIDPTRALLREIIEERYISGFGTFIPFNDARRLRKNDADIAVDFPLNVPSANEYPERFPYSDDELATNANAPAEPGIFVKTEVNK